MRILAKTAPLVTTSPALFVPFEPWSQPAGSEQASITPAWGESGCSRGAGELKNLLKIRTLYAPCRLSNLRKLVELMGIEPTTS